MIKFPAPKVPAPQFQGATRSKAARRTAELRKKNFLAHAANGALNAATTALSAPRAVVEVDGQQLGINGPDGHLADGTEIEHKSA